MTEITAQELQDGEIFAQYYKSDSHKDLFIGKYIKDDQYQWITCEIIYHYRSKKEYKEYKVLLEHEHYLDAKPMASLANRSTYFGEVTIFRLSAQELGSIAMEQI